MYIADAYLISKPPPFDVELAPYNDRILHALDVKDVALLLLSTANPKPIGPLGWLLSQVMLEGIA
jgi:hypothetical protein